MYSVNVFLGMLVPTTTRFIAAADRKLRAAVASGVYYSVIGVVGRIPSHFRAEILPPPLTLLLREALCTSGVAKNFPFVRPFVLRPEGN